jgi:hypothetical protein
MYKANYRQRERRILSALKGGWGWGKEEEDPGDEPSSILPTSIGSADGSSGAKRLAEVAA